MSTASTGHPSPAAASGAPLPRTRSGPSASAGRRVRFGVVGAGFIATWFARAVAAEPAAEIVAVASARPERAAAFAAEHGVPHAHPTLEAMLAEHGPDRAAPIDVIYIGSPNSLHAAQAIAALEAGYGVLVEKPFALTPAQARAMAATAERTGGFLMEAWQTAFEPGAAAIRAALPRLGEPRRATFVREQFSSRMSAYRAGDLPPAFDPALGGGSLMDLGIYPVSLAIHLFGPPDRVTATAQLLDSGVDSHGTVTLSYDTGERVGLEVACLHSKTSANALGSQISGESRAILLDHCQWPEHISLITAPGSPEESREDLSVTRSGEVMGPLLAEVCRLVSAGARGSELHPVSASVAAIEVLSEARAQIGVHFPDDDADA
ncbi:Gfo/Idh/MocA family protein [Actinomyces marmotae]|uniref:Gfo/Idh/MocA family oxidoreductase n=1 Tax=Actinomyces marmotae TaxID=2737173 RepID=A0A6M8B846_9ACTO|nr:Gfo/Idh/MocA family oxidoreductase [Actinomyces marmotae]QKD79383.1 Gfo/Idh/MocA family oxidoreductase [Actinomyces marmotae]